MKKYYFIRSFFLGLIFISFSSYLLATSYEYNDMITFGDLDSEKLHYFDSDSSAVINGGLQEFARVLLPLQPNTWEGGRLSFKLKIDPVKQNYVTVKFWGSDINSNYLILYLEGKQVGYRHLGDIDVIDRGSNEPVCNDRFYYVTTPLPIHLTRDKDLIELEIHSTGRIWGYGNTFEKYQKIMNESSRGIYRAYTHTDACFQPMPDEKQGKVIQNSPQRKEPGLEVIAQIKERVNNELKSYFVPDKILNQMQMQFAANAYHVKWTLAYHNSSIIQKILEGADKLYFDFKNDNTIAQNGPSSYNPEWFGLGPVGDSLRLLEDEIKPYLNENIDGGISRKDAWSEMLCYSRDWHCLHRRLYTNQSMINDLYGIYLSNRGVAVVNPQKSFSENEALSYLYESIGLEPWRGSDKGSVGQIERRTFDPVVGEKYMQLTKKGLTKELGFVGYYGEVLDWVTTIYNATRPKINEEGDFKIKSQLKKMAKARSYFRYPALDSEGYKAMRIETIVGWRDTYYPGDVVYGERPTWDASAIYLAGSILDDESVGFVQQMFDDNQYFNSVKKQFETKWLRQTAGLLHQPDMYSLLNFQPRKEIYLPMTKGEPDFVFSDEEDGVVAIKNGKEILYVSLYWRARFAINNLARVHYITPSYDRVAVVNQEVKFEPSGMLYKRKNWTNFGFGNGGLRYPNDVQSAHAGQELPIAKIPDGIKYRNGDENVYAGKGDLYVMQYGDYLVLMNCTEAKNYVVSIPGKFKNSIDLVKSKKMMNIEELNVLPCTTVVLYIE